MKPEAIVLAVAGTFFGIIIGWVIGSQQTGPPPMAAPSAQQAAAQTSGAATQAAPAPHQLDQAQGEALQAAAAGNPADVQTRVQLGKLYFDAERYEDAANWYQEALRLAPRDANVSTDLGVAFYYLNQTDRALQQFEQSLSIDPGHTKTMLNKGIVLAFGRQDLKGAVASWEKLIATAPDSQEAAVARRSLDGLRTAHPDLGPGAATSGPVK